MIIIQRLREKEQLTQVDLALEAGLSQPVISEIEHGLIRRPRLETLLKLARVLDCDPSYLLRKVEELTPDERKELGLEH